MSNPNQGASPMEGGGVGGGGAVPIPSSIPPEFANAPVNQTLLEAKEAARRDPRYYRDPKYYLDCLNGIKNSKDWKEKASTEHQI